MYFTNVTAYQVSMHDKCHYVLYGCTVTVPSLHFDKLLTPPTAY